MTISFSWCFQIAKEGKDLALLAGMRHQDDDGNDHDEDVACFVEHALVEICCWNLDC